VRLAASLLLTVGLVVPAALSQTLDPIETYFSSAEQNRTTMLCTNAGVTDTFRSGDPLFQPVL
jgi:hypothetical protein